MLTLALSAVAAGCGVLSLGWLAIVLVVSGPLLVGVATLLVSVLVWLLVVGVAGVSVPDVLIVLVLVVLLVEVVALKFSVASLPRFSGSCEQEESSDTTAIRIHSFEDDVEFKASPPVYSVFCGACCGSIADSNSSSKFNCSIGSSPSDLTRM